MTFVLLTWPFARALPFADSFCCSSDPAYSAMAGEDAVSIAASSTAGPACRLALLPVSFTLSKPCCCCLCNSTSTGPSLLNTPEELDSYGGERPWGKYRKVRSAETDSFFKVGGVRSWRALVTAASWGRGQALMMTLWKNVKQSLLSARSLARSCWRAPGFTTCPGRIWDCARRWHQRDLLGELQHWHGDPCVQDQRAQLG